MAEHEPTLLPLMSRAQQVEHLILFLLWLAAFMHFWMWWFQDGHNIGSFRFVVTTAVLLWFSLMPLYFFVVTLNGRVPNPARPVPPGYRVAMVVTKAPSEPLSVVQETLTAMLGQRYRHDTWLADEDPLDETVAWCRRHGVKISTRRGLRNYHRAAWPRRTRCKEGNLAFFYDHFGFGDYDIVCQLDADHVPDIGYLEEMLRPFSDPHVGYVSAPSICDRNASESWSARGRLHLEGLVHGALQAGHAGGLAPLCIGSHYAVRTIALEQIGGLGPELAEDHSTTLMMNAHGWRGVHAIQAIAHGDGPRTFADLATQEFQWSRSLTTIFLQYAAKYLPRLPLRMKIQFLFCQLSYAVSSILLATAAAIPIGALLCDANMVGIAFPDFFWRFALMSLPPLAVLLRWKRRGWMRPAYARTLSWEGVLYVFARWPWWLLGTIASLRDWIFRSSVDFRVTPKGAGPAAPLPFRVLAPYAFLSVASGLAATLVSEVDVAEGFYVFALVNSAAYAILLAVIVVMHGRENGRPPERSRGAFGWRGGLVALVLLIPAIGIPLQLPQGIENFTWGSERIVRWQALLPGHAPEGAQEPAAFPSGSSDERIARAIAAPEPAAPADDGAGSPARIDRPGKIGIGTWDIDGVGTSLRHVEALDFAWYYNWKEAPLWAGAARPAGSAAFVPMIWGRDQVTDEILSAIAASRYAELLGFNEPDHYTQSLMTVDEAVALWPRLMSAGKRLGSPAASTGQTLGEESWLARFMREVDSRGYRVDFMAVHYLSDDEDVGAFKSFLEAVHAKYGRPIWVTEWALVDWDAPDRFSREQTAAFAREAIHMMDDLPFVERHAWFAAYGGGDGWHINTELIDAQGRITPVGRAFLELRDMAAD